MAWGDDVPRAKDLGVRERVVKLVMEGSSRQDAAVMGGVSIGTVGRWLRRVRSGGDLAPTQPRRGGNRIFDDDDLGVLRELTAANPERTVYELREDMHRLTGKQVSYGTLRRSLRTLGIRRRRPERTVDLTPDKPAKAARYLPKHRRKRRGDHYPSSLTDHEWSVLQPIFEGTKPNKRGRPPKHNRRLMLDAVFYVVRSGCTWRMLPAHFPPWETVYAAFDRWKRTGQLERVYEALRVMWREREGRDPEASAGIVDSQSVRTTEKGGLEVTTVQSA